MTNFNFDFSFIKDGSPIVTLSSIGIAFNAGARRVLKYPEEIMIGFDEEKNTIGVLEWDGDENKNHYTFESRQKDNWVRVSMRDFMKYLSMRTGIDFLEKAIQFLPEYDEENNILIIVVDKEHKKNKF